MEFLNMPEKNPNTDTTPSQNAFCNCFNQIYDDVKSTKQFLKQRGQPEYVLLIINPFCVQ